MHINEVYVKCARSAAGVIRQGMNWTSWQSVAWYARLLPSQSVKHTPHIHACPHRTTTVHGSYQLSNA